MEDATLGWGGDLSAGPTGDLATIDGIGLGQQRVLRRLLTNSNDYTWEPGYGGGLGSFVGQTVSARAVTGLIRAQLLLEAYVAPQPTPIVVSNTTPDGSVFVDIAYTDATSQTTQTLTFSLGT